MSRGPSQRNLAYRVAFVTPGLSCGGAERWCITLARHFSSSVKTVGFISGGRGALTREAEKIAPVVHPFQGKDLLKHADCIIAWGWEHLADITEGFGGRIIAVSHGEPGGEWQDRVTAAMAKTPRVELTGVSSRSLDAWPNRGCGTYIPNGVEVERVAPRKGRAATRRELGLNDDQQMALFMGRLSPEKRPWLMHEMLEFLPEQWVSVICGPDMAGYSLGMAHKERVIVLPSVEFPGDLLAAADVFVLPSETEAHPLALTEAWLAGVPAVYCNWPFATQIREAHKVDLGYVPGVVKDLTGQQLAFAVNLRWKQRGDFLTEWARKAAWENYTAAAMAHRWETFLGMTKPLVPLIFK